MFVFVMKTVKQKQLAKHFSFLLLSYSSLFYSIESEYRGTAKGVVLGSIQEWNGAHGLMFMYYLVCVCHVGLNRVVARRY